MGKEMYRHPKTFLNLMTFFRFFKLFPTRGGQKKKVQTPPKL